MKKYGMNNDSNRNVIHIKDSNGDEIIWYEYDLNGNMIHCVLL